MKIKQTILMLLISFSAFGQQNTVHFKPDYYDDYTYHKDVYEPKEPNLFVLQNADTLADLQFLAFNFESGVVALLDKQGEELGRLFFMEKDNAIFISTDPMWHKYPHLSSYHYCSNNPIMRIDPTGKYDYEVNETSKKITRTGTKDSPDRFLIKNENGETIATSENYKAGTVSKLENSKIGSTFSVSNDTDRGEIFKFLAKNTTADVEWQTLSGNDNKGNELNRIGTNYKPDGVTILNGEFNKMFDKGNNVNEFTHSHTRYGSPIPSGYDPNSEGYRRGDYANAVKTGKGVLLRVYSTVMDMFFRYDIDGIYPETNNTKKK